MDSQKAHQLHVFLLPLMAPGHMIPIIGMAKLFSIQGGIRTSIITTPVHATRISKLIEKTKNMNVLTIKFPSVEVGMPEGFESLEMAKSPEMKQKFFKATTMLAHPLEQLLKRYSPTCLVSDMFFTWSTDVASSCGIPRFVFHGTCCFAACATECVRLYEPHKMVSSEMDPFVIPNFPSDVKLSRQQLPDYVKEESHYLHQEFIHMRESEIKSRGVLVNSFYELEPAYADHYRRDLGRKAWHIGPLWLWNSGAEDKVNRGRETSIDEHECLKWLSSKKPNSVVYVCFGSVADFTASQLLEIALALENSGLHFIWVVKEKKQENWLPEGYEKRMEGKGLIIWGWAPQILILEHAAVGGFMTHCGWNSTLEAIVAGVPMVTWPVSSEQFFNEKLVTEILRIGVGVGVKKWARLVGDSVKKEAIEKAVSHVMEGKETEEMRCRARMLRDVARRAVEEGGSSHSDFKAFIEELKSKDSFNH